MIAFENGFAKRRVLKDELLSVAPRWEKVYYWFRFIAARVGLRGLANTNKPQKLCKKNITYFLTFHKIILYQLKENTKSKRKRSLKIRV